eukprot:6418737-Pyramimonas_sp.AAC.1
MGERLDPTARGSDGRLANINMLNFNPTWQPSEEISTLSKAIFSMGTDVNCANLKCEACGAHRTVAPIKSGCKAESRAARAARAAARAARARVV